MAAGGEGGEHAGDEFAAGDSATLGKDDSKEGKTKNESSKEDVVGLAMGGDHLRPEATSLAISIGSTPYNKHVMFLNSNIQGLS